MKPQISSFQLILITVILTLLLFIPQSWISWYDYKNFNSFVNYEFRLSYLAQRANYLDEVLTMSAQMYAMTANAKWKERYNLHEPELDEVIQESLKIAPGHYASEDAEAINAINEKLIEIETLTFDLVKQGKIPEAQLLLFSGKYENFKKEYSAASSRRNSFIHFEMQEHLRHYNEQLVLAILISVVSFLVLIPLWLLVLRLLQAYKKLIKN